MKQGFFDLGQDENTQPTASGRPDCTHCGLLSDCKSPQMEGSGDGEKRILVIAQSPGTEEDEQGTQLVGQSGQMARMLLRRSGIDLERDCRRINAVNCYPCGKSLTATHVKRCRPMVWEEIKQNPPHVIIPMGTEAVMSLLGHRYIGDPSGFQGIGRWRGWTIPDQLLKAWVCPVFHPSYILRQGGKEDISYKITAEDIERAIGLCDVDVPDYGDEKAKIELLWERRFIERTLNAVSHLTTPVAFDFETTGLKPERERHRILTCAISDCGNRAWSFPVQGVEEYLTEFLKSPVPKVAANKKFETRWSRACLGVDPQNWVHDTMLDAHYLDNRRSITSVKFQTCVRFGNPDYDSHLEPYKRGVDTQEHASNAFNRLHEVDPEELMVYGGMDAMYEMRIYEQQKHERA